MSITTAGLKGNWFLLRVVVVVFFYRKVYPIKLYKWMFMGSTPYITVF